MYICYTEYGCTYAILSMDVHVIWLMNTEYWSMCTRGFTRKVIKQNKSEDSNVHKSFYDCFYVSKHAQFHGFFSSLCKRIFFGSPTLSSLPSNFILWGDLALVFIFEAT